MSLHLRALVAALGAGLLVPLVVLNGAHADPRPDDSPRSSVRSIPDADYKLSDAAKSRPDPRPRREHLPDGPDHRRGPRTG